MLTYFRNTSSYWVLTQVCAMHDERKMRQDPRFEKKMKSYAHQRLLGIINQGAYKGIFG
jgi:hypothetical protein